MKAIPTLLLLFALGFNTGLMLKLFQRINHFYYSYPKVLEKTIIVRTVYAEKVTVTAYAPVRSQTDDTPYVTAIVEKPIPGKTCAVSRDLARKGWLGKRIWIEGIGVFIANDVMHPKWTKRIDICLNEKIARKFTPRQTYAIILD